MRGRARLGAVSAAAALSGLAGALFLEITPPGGSPDEASHFVRVEGLTKTLCGPRRPGHFEGVATIVAALFNMVGPDRAVIVTAYGTAAAVDRHLDAVAEAASTAKLT